MNNKTFILLLLISHIVIKVNSQTQEKAIIKIVHSDEARIGKNGQYKLIGNVKLTHNEIIMTCDSLYQYPDSNYIEAFSRVHVLQNDTLNLWGDYLTYDGDTEQTQVRNNVTMQDNTITLKTDSLDYNAGYKIGYYFSGGEIKDSTNTLISIAGYYYVPLNEIVFEDSVIVYTPNYTLYSDTMEYHTQDKIISILGPTNIHGDNRKLYSEDGWYNSLTAHSELYKNNKFDYTTYFGYADTVIIDSTTQSIIMRQNIELNDTINDVIIAGNYGEILENDSIAFVTQKSLLTLIGQTDSLFLHSDTLKLSKDTLSNNIIEAYYNTKFFSQDLQGMCDSMRFPVADSTVYLYKDPIVWADGNQMIAESIDMHMVGNTIDKFNLREKGMIINELDSTYYKLTIDQHAMYNQIKGRNITGFIKNNQLYLIEIDGSGEAIYYPDDKGIIIGLNKASSSKIKIDLENQKIKDITFIQNVEGSLNPLFMIKEEDHKFNDFVWHINKRPKNKLDIFNLDINHTKITNTLTSELDKQLTKELKQTQLSEQEISKEIAKYNKFITSKNKRYELPEELKTNISTALQAKIEQAKRLLNDGNIEETIRQELKKINSVGNLKDVQKILEQTLEQSVINKDINDKNIDDQDLQKIKDVLKSQDYQDKIQESIEKIQENKDDKELKNILEEEVKKTIEDFKPLNYTF